MFRVCKGKAAQLNASQVFSWPDYVDVVDLTIHISPVKHLTSVANFQCECTSTIDMDSNGQPIYLA